MRRARALSSCHYRHGVVRSTDRLTVSTSPLRYRYKAENQRNPSRVDSALTAKGGGSMSVLVIAKSSLGDAKSSLGDANISLDGAWIALEPNPLLLTLSLTLTHHLARWSSTKRSSRP